MNMHIYTAGWALQNPALNYFKIFLKVNSNLLSIKGIIYPKKIPRSIENISILDFQDAIKDVKNSATIVDCIIPDNKLLAREVHSFFQENGFSIKSIPNFINKIINEDIENSWETPFHGISTENIRKLQKETGSKLTALSFLDPASYEVACILDDIFRTSKWDELIKFDQDSTLDQSLLELLELTHKIHSPQIYQILDDPVFFLSELLKLQQVSESRGFKIIINKKIIPSIGNNFDFYQECFKNRIFVEDNDIIMRSELEITYLSNTAQKIISIIQNGLPVKSAVFLMQRSILDYHDLTRILGKRNFRIALRQPDTQHSHLVASLIS